MHISLNKKKITILVNFYHFRANLKICITHFRVTFFRTLCDIQTEQKKMLLNASHRLLALRFLTYLKKNQDFGKFQPILEQFKDFASRFRVTFLRTLCNIQTERTNILLNASHRVLARFFSDLFNPRIPTQNRFHNSLRGGVVTTPRKYCALL